MHTSPEDEHHVSQLRLFLEEVCCDLCRFEHAAESDSYKNIRIDREFYLDRPGAYADLRVSTPGAPPYFVEIKYGYPDAQLLERIRTKYSVATPATQGGYKLVLIVDAAQRPTWPALERELRAMLPPGLPLEIWDDQRFLSLLRERFQVEVDAITPKNLLDIRQAIDRTKGLYAFGEPTLSALHSALLWHFGFWRLRELREDQGLAPRDILPPGSYRGVIVLMADICSFSSYVRDTPDAAIIRENLTAFYSKSRYQIIHSGGMLYAFAGDEVIGLYGVPQAEPNDASRAVQTARALLEIGNSISQRWQRRIDRVQNAKGLHVGMAVGDLEMVPLRPYSRTHIGAIGDCINLAARLMKVAGPGEIVLSNSLFQQLHPPEQNICSETEPIDAHNMGRIKAWKMRPAN